MNALGDRQLEYWGECFGGAGDLALEQPGDGQRAASASHSAECPVLGRCPGVGVERVQSEVLGAVGLGLAASGQRVGGVVKLAWPAEGAQPAEAVQLVGLHPVPGIGGACQGGVRVVEPVECGQRPCLVTG